MTFDDYLSHHREDVYLTDFLHYLDHEVDDDFIFITGSSAKHQKPSDSAIKNLSPNAPGLHARRSNNNQSYLSLGKAQEAKSSLAKFRAGAQMVIAANRFSMKDLKRSVDEQNAIAETPAAVDTSIVTSVPSEPPRSPPTAPAVDRGGNISTNDGSSGGGGGNGGAEEDFAARLAAISAANETSEATPTPTPAPAVEELAPGPAPSPSPSRALEDGTGAEAGKEEEGPASAFSNNAFAFDKMTDSEEEEEEGG